MRIDLEHTRQIRDIAYRFIINDDALSKLWHDAKTDSERQILLTAVVFEEAYDRGYKDGHVDGYDEAMDDRARDDAGESL